MRQQRSRIRLLSRRTITAPRAIRTVWPIPAPTTRRPASQPPQAAEGSIQASSEVSPATNVSGRIEAPVGAAGRKEPDMQRNDEPAPPVGNRRSAQIPGRSRCTRTPAEGSASGTLRSAGFPRRGCRHSAPRHPDEITSNPSAPAACDAGSNGGYSRSASGRKADGGGHGTRIALAQTKGWAEWVPEVAPQTSVDLRQVWGSIKNPPPRQRKDYLRRGN